MSVPDLVASRTEPALLGLETDITSSVPALEEMEKW
jgi:hypothetical protein